MPPTTARGQGSLKVTRRRAITTPAQADTPDTINGFTAPMQALLHSSTSNQHRGSASSGNTGPKPRKDEVEHARVAGPYGCSDGGAASSAKSGQADARPMARSDVIDWSSSEMPAQAMVDQHEEDSGRGVVGFLCGKMRARPLAATRTASTIKRRCF